MAALPRGSRCRAKPLRGTAVGGSVVWGRGVEVRVYPLGRGLLPGPFPLFLSCVPSIVRDSRLKALLSKIKMCSGLRSWRILKYRDFCIPDDSAAVSECSIFKTRCVFYRKKNILQWLVTSPSPMSCSDNIFLFRMLCYGNYWTKIFQTSFRGLEHAGAKFPLSGNPGLIRAF